MQVGPNTVTATPWYLTVKILALLLSAVYMRPKIIVGKNLHYSLIKVNGFSY